MKCTGNIIFDAKEYESIWDNEKDSWEYRSYVQLLSSYVAGLRLLKREDLPNIKNILPRQMSKKSELKKLFKQGMRYRLAK